MYCNYETNELLSDIIMEGPPEFKQYDLFAWFGTEEDRELFYIGNIKDVYEQYENHSVYFVDVSTKEMWLSGVFEE